MFTPSLSRRAAKRDYFSSLSPSASASGRGCRVYRPVCHRRRRGILCRLLFERMLFFLQFRPFAGDPRTLERDFDFCLLQLLAPFFLRVLQPFAFLQDQLVVVHDLGDGRGTDGQFADLVALLFEQFAEVRDLAFLGRDDFVGPAKRRFDLAAIVGLKTAVLGLELGDHFLLHRLPPAARRRWCRRLPPSRRALSEVRFEFGVLALQARTSSIAISIRFCSSGDPLRIVFERGLLRELLFGRVSVLLGCGQFRRQSIALGFERTKLSGLGLRSGLIQFRVAQLGRAAFCRSPRSCSSSANSRAIGRVVGLLVRAGCFEPRQSVASSSARSVAHSASC